KTRNSKIHQYAVINLFLLFIFVFSVSAQQLSGKSDDPNTNNDWLERIDKIHEAGYDDWLTVAWAAMLAQQEGIIPKKDVPKVAGVLLELFNRPAQERGSGWGYIWGIDDYFMKE